MNYLFNAIRYTADGGRIEITAAYTENGMRLAIFNEGDGLPEDELPKIWEKFYRTDRARARLRPAAQASACPGARDRGDAARQLRRGKRGGVAFPSGLSFPIFRSGMRPRKLSTVFSLHTLDNPFKSWYS